MFSRAFLNVTITVEGRKHIYNVDLILSEFSFLKYLQKMSATSYNVLTVIMFKIF